MRILHVDDNYTDLQLMRNLITDAFGVTVEITPCLSEGEFCHLLETDSVIPGYDLIVMDVMLPWALPGQDVGPVPPEVDQQSVFRAGIRNCQRIGRHLPPEKRAEVILLTVLDSDDLASAMRSLKDRYRMRPLLLRKDDVMEVIECIRRKLAS